MLGELSLSMNLTLMSWGQCLAVGSASPPGKFNYPPVLQPDPGYYLRGKAAIALFILELPDLGTCSSVFPRLSTWPAA